MIVLQNYLTNIIVSITLERIVPIDIRIIFNLADFVLLFIT